MDCDAIKGAASVKWKGAGFSAPTAFVRLQREVCSPGAVARACNPSSWEAEVGGSNELGSSGL